MSTDTGKKKILSLDGGGMRGVITLGMLAELEAYMQKPVYEIFDMVVGTSTGAVIAAAIATRMTAEDVLEKVYKQVLPKAFGSNWVSWARFGISGFKYRYTHKPFLEHFSDRLSVKIKDVSTIIVLMTVKDVRTGNTYYVTNAGKGAAAFAHWPLIVAATASSSAPLYFPPISGNLIDGGLSAYNNPSFVAATEAMEYMGSSYGFYDGNVELYSFGAGNTNRNTPDKEAGNWRALKWLDYITSEAIDDSSLDAVYATRQAFSGRLDYRRYNPDLSNNVFAELGVAPPNQIDISKLRLNSTRADEIEIMELLGREYAKQINWEQSGVMPWDTVGGQQKPLINGKI